MAVFVCHKAVTVVVVAKSQSQNPSPNFSSSLSFRHSQKLTPSLFNALPLRRRLVVVNGHNEGSNSDLDKPQDQEVDNLGVRAALSILKFYKGEISPLLPKSCRYVPTCSEYSMEAYKKYGVVKGTILTTWRLCRCNPLGGSGFDPPRWFGETSLPEE
ncbi:hypothetical protein L484_021270 [Morus notabilis]|uniref:Uncharacterized protein n=1 Tax=Morus notabilis TaxID=981085 RepID=W9S7Z1_9ROSA|nr:UPF0161 protein At3g09310 [Morus notabilis]EXC30970.1 hypothetical protein L484_021270 [Morus notabilis]